MQEEFSGQLLHLKRLFGVWGYFGVWGFLFFYSLDGRKFKEAK
jgi:hypothetical protein